MPGRRPGVFNLVNGTGEVVGTPCRPIPMSTWSRFTGSTRAGVLVAQNAAPTVKRVVQELGGKSPNVFLPDADFADAVPKGVLGAMRNVGQSCAAPTRMVVPRARLAEVEALAREAAEGIVVGDPNDEACFIGPLANKPQFEKVQGLIQAGHRRRRQADRAAGPACRRASTTAISRGRRCFPKSRPRCASRRRRSSARCWSSSPTRTRKTRSASPTRRSTASPATSSRPTRKPRAASPSRIRAGQVHINYPAWSGFAPFGGYRQSGNGREYGGFAIEEYLETKAILGY